ncbi:MAG: LLM class flavin-dependent oxidoreductase [Balneolaceae bacterium]|nr:LLM class flavin-dependent oxidoreductase [Balneolaceae bacterium]
MSFDTINYSILDLAVINEGQTPADAIRNSREVAIEAEKLGYTRFWMAEHHNMENIASSATSVLLGHVAEATNSIRVGSGGVMLPNHSPLIIAEQFGTLASIYPNRIDLGLGRAPGTDQTTAQEIRADRMQQVHNFPQNVKKLQQFLSEQNSQNKVRAIPGEGTDVPLWILGSSTDSAHLAAALGLPYVFASHFAPQQLMPALQIYQNNFSPSKQQDDPYVMTCLNVVAAETDDEAEWLASSMKRMMMGVVTGERNPLQPPVDDWGSAWNYRQKAAVQQMLSYSLIGSKDTVKQKLLGFLDQTRSNEVMITSHIFDQQAKLESYQLFADVMKDIKPNETEKVS